MLPRRIIVPLFAAVLSVVPRPAFAQTTRYVSRAGTHTAPYTNWTMAATNPHAAFAVAVSNNIVLFTNGTWTLTNTVTLATGITVRSVNGPSATILEGNDTFRLFSLSGGAKLEGLTLRRGRAAAAGAGGYGGAIYANNARMSNLVIASCVATGRGGGVYFFTSAGLLTHSRIEQCDSPYGGGVYCRNVGVVSNCVFTGNRAIGPAGTGGGGVNLYQGGTASHCDFLGNTAGNDGGGVLIEEAGGVVYNSTFRENIAGDWGGAAAVYFAGGVLRNSIMVSNRADEGGGVYFHQSGSLENCTVAGNTAIQDGDGVKFSDGGTSVNSIIYFNGDENVLLSGTGMAIRNTCTTPAIVGAADQGGNLSGDPSFLYRPESVLHLNPDSPCIGAGTNDGWMAAGTDLYGSPRIIHTAVDIGAYEFGPLVTHFVGSPRAGQPPLVVDFQSYTTGSNLLNLVYHWDAQNDGAPEATGAVYDAFSHTYPTGGLYTVRLAVTNAAGQVAQLIRTNYVFAFTPQYVATNGGHVSPFSSWATAATNLEAALAVSPPDGEIFVSNGSYLVRAEISVTQAVRITSVNGPSVTHLVGTGSSRVLRVRSGVNFSGFTLRGGAATGAALNACGGGVYLDGGGLVSNCIVAANRASSLGGGVYLHYGGDVRACTIYSNRAQSGGGLAAYAGGLGYNLVISTNTAADRGGGVYLFGNSVLRNAIVDHNAAASNGGGAALISSGAALQNCTIASNAAAYGGGVLCEDGGNVQNTIAYFNTAATSFPNWQTNTAVYNYGAVFTFSCLTPTTGLPSATGCITNNPLFASSGALAYGLDGLSPCVNRGAYSAWMLDAVDLLGNPRVVGGAPDVGALERLLLALSIQSPVSGTRLPFGQTFVQVSGTATGLVGQIAYTNRYPGGAVSGAVPVSSNWSFTVAMPRYGEQVISISATGAAGQTAVDTLTIRRNRNQVFLPTQTR